MTQTIKTQKIRSGERPAGARAAEELTLRVEAAGYGGVPMRAVVPGATLSSLERGALPVETRLKVKTPGYGWRFAGVRISQGAGGTEKTKSVRLTVPGYGQAPLRMAFLGGTQ